MLPKRKCFQNATVGKSNWCQNQILPKQKGYKNENCAKSKYCQYTNVAKTQMLIKCRSCFCLFLYVSVFFLRFANIGKAQILPTFQLCQNANAVKTKMLPNGNYCPKANIAKMQMSPKHIVAKMQMLAKHECRQNINVSKTLILPKG